MFIINSFTNVKLFIKNFTESFNYKNYTGNPRVPSEVFVGDCMILSANQAAIFQTKHSKLSFALKLELKPITRTAL